MKPKHILFYLTLMVLSAACSQTSGGEPRFSGATLPPVWTETVPATGAGTESAELIIEEDVITPPDEPEDTSLVVEPEMPFDGADQWWRQLPQALLVHASGTADGGLLLLARVKQSDPDGELIGIRVKADGTIDWQRSIEGIRYPSGILETRDGGVLVFENGHLHKLDGQGEYLWSNVYAFSEIGYGDQLFGPIQDVNQVGGGTQVVGRYGDITTLDSEGNPTDMYIAGRLAFGNDDVVASADLSGTVSGSQLSRTVYSLSRRSSLGPSWGARFDFIAFDITLFPPYAVRATRDGGVLFLAPAPHVMRDGGFSVFIARLNRVGNLLWGRIYDGVYEDDFYIRETSDGGFLLADTHTRYGTTYQGSFLRLTRFNQSGYISWDRYYGDGEMQIQARNIIERPEGGFIIIGQHGYRGENDSEGGISMLFVDEQGRIPGCRLLTELPQAEMLGRSPSFQSTQGQSIALVRGDVIESTRPGRDIALAEGDAYLKTLCSYPSALFPTGEADLPDEARVRAFFDEEGMLIGGVQGKTWYSALDVAAQLSPGTSFHLYNLTSHVGASAAEVSSPPSSAACPNQTYLTTTEDQRIPYRIGLDSGWNAVPQIPTVISSNIAVYQDLLDEWLKDNGLWNAVISIDEVVKVDLQGDGADEVLIVANHNEGGVNRDLVTQGDYSVLLLRRFGAEGIETVPLYERYETANRSGSIPGELELVGVFDLNGDGMMDIVAREGRWREKDYMVFDTTQTLLDPVIETACLN